MAVLKIGGKTVVPAIVNIKYDIPEWMPVYSKASADGKTIERSKITSYATGNDVTKISTFALYRAFSAASGMTSAVFTNVEEIGDRGLRQGFYDNTTIQSISFPKLKKINVTAIDQMCQGCTALASISFPSLEDVGGSSGFRFLLTGCTNVQLTFPSALRSTIEGLTGYPNFDGTNTTIVYI